jgi:hypothetical protein
MVFPWPVSQQISVLGLHAVCRGARQAAAHTPLLQTGVALPVAQHVIEA